MTYEQIAEMMEAVSYTHLVTENSERRSMVVPQTDSKPRLFLTLPQIWFVCVRH